MKTENDVRVEAIDNDLDIVECAAGWNIYNKQQSIHGAPGFKYPVAYFCNVSYFDARLAALAMIEGDDSPKWAELLD